MVVKNLIAITFVHRDFIKKQGRPKQTANIGITFEQSACGKIHTFQLLNSSREANGTLLLTSMNEVCSG